MQHFKDYVVSEYKVEGTTSILFKFAHSLSVKLDKKTKKPLNNHTINCTVQFYDKDLNLLHKASIKFINNVLNKNDAKKLINISPKELENRFNAARREIVSEIQKDYIEKRNDIDQKIYALSLYESVNVDVIPDEFKGELIQMNTNTNTKPSFDM